MNRDEADKMDTPYKTRIFKSTRLVLFICSAVLISSSILSQAKIFDDVLPAGKIDKPEITLLKLKCKELQANEDNAISVVFKFKDKRANLNGGSMSILITEDTGSKHEYNFDLEHKKFDRESGKFKFRIEVNLGNCKNISVRAQLRDSLNLKSKTKTVERAVKGADNGGGGGGDGGSNAPWGTQVGERAVNFSLLDQNGKQVNLHDYAGKVILLDFSAMWCSPCMQESSEAQEFYLKYKDQGFIILTVLIQNYSGGSIVSSDCKIWSNKYGLSIPVLADTNLAAWNKYDDEGYVPLNLIIDRNLEIQHKQAGFSREYFEQLIVGLLNK